jgi:protein MPE1
VPHPTITLSYLPHPPASGIYCPRILAYSAITEYRDDSQIVPRSTSVVVKRRPAVRPGKGKAAMYISGAPGASSEKHTPIVTPANNTWHRPGLASGHSSKRFDSREKDRERDEPQKPVRVVA